MSVVVVTGSAGLIGAEAVAFLAQLGFDVVGLDNSMRRRFFGPDASTAPSRRRLAATREFAPTAPFIFTSTNKVYGDTPNRLPLQELETRWEIDPAHPYAHGIPEEMGIDQRRHSIFGASKVAADVMVQEYGRYFEIGRFSHCSMLEAIALCEEITGRPLDWRHSPAARIGDHIWWVSDVRRLKRHYPDWRLRHDVPAPLREIHEANVERWQPAAAR